MQVYSTLYSLQQIVDTSLQVYSPCNCPGGKGHAKQTSGGKVPGGE